MSPDHFLAVVPARDERGHVGRCITSILRAARHAELDPARFHLVVVADSCVDDTASEARRALNGDATVLEVGAGSAGRARALGTAAGLRRWPAVAAERVWTVHTDADSVVPVQWLQEHRRLAALGVAAVAGVVDVDDFADHHPAVASLHTASYDLSGDDDHPHVHGANFGIRADVYRAVGGWATLATGEDNSLWDAVRAAGHPTRSTRTLRVVTSGRASGRAPSGFAAYLAGLAPTAELETAV